MDVTFSKSKRRAGQFFEKFEPFPGVFEDISPMEIDNGDLSRLPGTVTLVRAALTMARIMKFVGNTEKLGEFAEVGLHHLGRATALKAELEWLRDGR